MTTEQKRRNGTKKLTVLSEQEFKAAQDINSKWHYILGTVGQSWNKEMSKKWSASSLETYEFYLREYVPTQTKLGHILKGLDGQED